MVSEVDPGKVEAIYKAASVASEINLMAADFPEREFEMYRLLRQHLPICRSEGMGGGLLEENGAKSSWFFARH